MKAIYTRQSLDKKDSISIETQVDECMARKGNAMYKVYSDKGYSGKNTQRPAFKEMMDDIKSGVIDQVIVYKLDRISRNVVDFVQMHETFTKYGASFVSCKEGFDSSNQLGRLLMMMLISFAQFERESIQQRVKDSYYARGSKGFYMGGRIPFGFDKEEFRMDGINTSQLVPNEAAETVKFLYETYGNSNMSLGKISKMLNEQGVLSAEGKKWDGGKISRILRSPLYVRANVDVYIYYQNKQCNMTNDISDYIGTNGCYVYGKREANERKYTDVTDHYVTLAPHEGLVDSDLWLIVQYKLDSNKQIKNSGQGKHTYMTGLMKCEKCGFAACVATSGYKGTKYLSCRGKSNNNACEGFKSVIKLHEVEEAVTRQLINRTHKLRGTTLEDTPNDTKTEINKLKIKLTQVKEQIDNLVAGMANGNSIVVKYLNDKITELDGEKDKIEAEILQKSVENRKTTNIDLLLDQIDNWDSLDFNIRRDVAKEFIDKIYINDDQINIKWKL